MINPLTKDSATGEGAGPPTSFSYNLYLLPRGLVTEERWLSLARSLARACSSRYCRVTCLFSFLYAVKY